MPQRLHDFLTGDAVLVSILVLALSGLGFISVVAWRTEPPPVVQAPDPPPTFRLSVSGDGTGILIEGAIDLGITSVLSRLLADFGDVRRLELRSDGGRVPEARGLIRLVTEYRLATVARGDCLSACALVFMAGSARRMEDGARLGFHSYALRSPVVAALMDVPAQQARDMDRFRALGIDGAFLDRIGATPPESMWFPSRQDLSAAGVLTDLPALR
jgi:hypothetical protein